MDHPGVLRFLNTQHRLVTMRQLRELGFSPNTILRAQKRGALDAILRGVYVLPGDPLSFETRAMAAQLYCGPRSYLSGRTAGALLGLREMSRKRIDITRPATSWVPMPDWVRPRHAAFTARADVMTLPSGHRVSGPLLTLFVLASELTEFRFHRAAENAWHLGLIDPKAASSYLEWIRRSGRGGVAMFETWLERVRTWERPAATGFELDVIDTVKRAGLPEPVRQHPLTLLDGVEIHIDIAWPDLRLGLEPGHSLFHLGDVNGPKDLSRFMRCNEVGWLIVPINEEMKHDLEGLALHIKQIYETRRTPPAS